MIRGLFLAAIAPLFLAAPAAAQTRVEVEIANTGGPATALEVQNWAKLLNQLRVDRLTIRQSQAGDKPKIESSGGDRTTYRVVAVLTERNELLLPGGRFTLRDSAGLEIWLKKLRQDGPAGSAKPKLPFGLSEAQLAHVMEDLSSPVNFSTANMDRADVLGKIAGKLSSQVAQPRQAAAALAEAGAVSEELQGMSAGTVLACILRPAGLGLAPKPVDKSKLQYEVVSLREETWPVGFYDEDKELKLMPEMVQQITAEIKPGTSMTKALAAISGRLKAPILMDHNSLAVADIDPNEVTVSVKSGRYLITNVVDRILSPSRMTKQVRRDEAGNPFLWVTAPR